MELSDIAVFVKVIQTGSFTQAALQLGAPKSTVSAKVASLERRLGVTLLQRTTRTLRVTAEGEVFFRTCAQALGDITAAEAMVTSQKTTLHGRLTVTLPVDTGRFIAKFLKTFLRQHPELAVDLVLTNRYVDLVAEGVDVALRAGVLKDTGLIARRLGTNQGALFAAPAYLKGVTAPRHPRELGQHQCLRYTMQKHDSWRLIHKGRTVHVKVDGRVTADDLTTLKELAVEGHGIILLPPVATRDEVAQKRLVPLLEGWHTEPVPVHLVYAAQKFPSPKVRVFVDEMATALKTVFEL